MLLLSGYFEQVKTSGYEADFVTMRVHIIIHLRDGTKLQKTVSGMSTGS